ANSMIVAVPNLFFDVLCALNLLWETAWLVASGVGGYSTLRMIAPGAQVTAGILVLSSIARLVAGESAAMAVLLTLCCVHIGWMIWRYNRTEAEADFKTT